MASPSVVNARPPIFTRKPGESFTTTGVRVICLPISTSASVVACEVAAATITSTSFIKGTGLKKCNPAIRSGWRQALAIEAMGIEEVLEAMIASFDTTASNLANSSRFTARSSNTASTTRSASATSSRLVTGCMRAAAFWQASWLMRSFSTNRSRRFVIAAFAASAPPSFISKI